MTNATTKDTPLAPIAIGGAVEAAAIEQASQGDHPAGGFTELVSKDPDLESLTPAHKQLVRGGPAHTEALRVWLRALQAGLM